MLYGSWKFTKRFIFCNCETHDYFHEVFVQYEDNVKSKIHKYLLSVLPYIMLYYSPTVLGKKKPGSPKLAKD